MNLNNTPTKKSGWEAAIARPYAAATAMYRSLLVALMLTVFSNAAMAQTRIIDVDTTGCQTNVAINNAVGQSFKVPTSTVLSSFEIWIKPNLYYNSTYNVEVYDGAGTGGTKLATSTTITMGPQQQNNNSLPPAPSQFYDFPYAAPGIALQANHTYTLRLVRLSPYSGAFSYCDNPYADGILYWLGTSAEPTKDMSFRLNGTAMPSNPAPTAISLSPASVPENSAAGTTVGTLSSTDANSTSGFTYALVPGTGSTDNASFSIVGDTLKTAAAFNFEVKNSYSIRVETTDVGGATYQQQLTVAVEDMNDAPAVSDQIVTTLEDTAKTISITATDAENDPLFFNVIIAPAHGTLSITDGTFVPGGPQSIQVIYTPNGNYNGPDTFTYTVSDKGGLYYSGTQHYYEFVSAPNITWSDAKVAAAARSLYGLQGYLATMTSIKENAFAAEKLSGTGWIGGTDEAQEGVWKWATGPEAGTQFWQGAGGGAPTNGLYTNWSPGEPNDVGANEDYAHMIYTSVGVRGSWNDLPNIGVPGNPYYQVAGYMVEYGGLKDDLDTFSTAKVDINVTPVNDAPVFTVGANQTVNAASGPQTVTDFATNIKLGPVTATDEAGQTLNFIVTNDNNTLFAVQPGINAAGNLTYTPAVLVSGTATVTVKLHDNGLTANGGVDTSAAQTFTITITPAPADLSITKTASSLTPVTGSNVTYTLTVTNNGPGAAANIVVSDVLPVGTTYVSSSNAGGTSSAAGNTVTATLETLAPGASATITVVATVNCNLAHNTALTNIATVSAGTPDLNAANNEARATVTASNPAPVVDCPNDITVGNDLGVCSATVVIAPVTAEDNCDGTIAATGKRSDNQPLDAPYPLGRTTIEWSAKDSSGNWSTSCHQVITVMDTEKPVAAADAAVTNEDTDVNITVLANDGDNCAQPTVTGVTQGDHGAVVLNADGTVTYEPTPDFNGTDTFTYAISDGHGNSAIGTVTVTIKPVNDPPKITELKVAPSEIDENNSATISGEFNDFDARDATPDTHKIVINWGDGSANSTINPATSPFTATHLYKDDNPTGTASDVNTITVTLTDSSNAANNNDTATTTIKVNNVAPVASAITGLPIVPVQNATAAATVTAKANFSDVGTQDTHTATWNWGDGATSAGIVTETNGSGSVSGSHTYSAGGVYTVSLTVKDDDTGVATVVIYQFVVVYEPADGFVTGGGWINSPVGAYKANPTLTGKANFGFNSKYKSGQTVPDGSTEFQFQAGSLNFKSSVYEWMVISGQKVRYRGTGTINGSGSYGFELTGIDSKVSGTFTTDRFRIKIWNNNQGNSIVYDNQVAGDATDGVDPVTTLGGGDITIHKTK